MNILVVEDESDVAELIRRVLEQLGNRCVVARDAATADRLLDREKVDAVTLDLAMPDRGGLEWLEGIASERPDLARKTLVITGLPLGVESVERLARCGAGVLAKPFGLEALREAVRTQIARPTAAVRARN
jgi:DNA-binding response OmpR family regulator